MQPSEAMKMLLEAAGQLYAELGCVVLVKVFDENYGR